MTSGRKGFWAGAAALPFGAAAAVLRYAGLLVVTPQAAWMLFWLTSALQVWVLTQLTAGRPGAKPHKKSQSQQDGWLCVEKSSAEKTADTGGLPAQLAPCLAGACGLCQLGALGFFCLQLPAAGAALWCGVTATGFVWLLLGLVALACETGNR